jgi:hypothetical protein
VFEAQHFATATKLFTLRPGRPFTFAFNHQNKHNNAFKGPLCDSTPPILPTTTTSSISILIEHRLLSCLAQFADNNSFNQNQYLPSLCLRKRPPSALPRPALRRRRRVRLSPSAIADVAIMLTLFEDPNAPKRGLSAYMRTRASASVRLAISILILKANMLTPHDTRPGRQGPR